LVSFYLYPTFAALLSAVGLRSLKHVVWSRHDVFCECFEVDNLQRGFSSIDKDGIHTSLFCPVIPLYVVWLSLFCAHLVLAYARSSKLEWRKVKFVKFVLLMEMRVSVLVDDHVQSFCPQNWRSCINVAYTSSLNARNISPWELFCTCSFACILSWGCLASEKEKTFSRMNHRLIFDYAVCHSCPCFFCSGGRNRQGYSHDLKNWSLF
jgi:hypothetical protein